MRLPQIGIQAFLDGFTMAGFLGGAKFPGGAQVLMEEEGAIEDSQFADLFGPFLAGTEKPADEEIAALEIGDGSAAAIKAADLYRGTYQRTVQEAGMPPRIISSGSFTQGIRQQA